MNVDMRVHVSKLGIQNMVDVFLSLEDDEKIDTLTAKLKTWNSITVALLGATASFFRTPVYFKAVVAIFVKPSS